MPQLRVCEHECWRAVYCGLCKCMGRHVCADSALALSYDAAFLALVRLAATGEKTEISARRCILHPTKKRLVMEPNDSLRFSASVGALLAYHKIADDFSDERTLFRLLLLPEAKRLRRKAGLSELDAIVTERLGALYEAERVAQKEHGASLDKLAELAGAALSPIFAYRLEGSAARVTAELGRRVGRWVYIADAAHDLEKDFRKKRFNPFLFGAAQENPEGGKLSAADREAAIAAMALERRAAEAAINLIECADAGIISILRNIITLGMGSVEEKLLCSSGA